MSGWEVLQLVLALFAMACSIGTVVLLGLTIRVLRQENREQAEEERERAGRGLRDEGRTP